MSNLRVLICDDQAHVRYSHENYLQRIREAQPCIQPVTEFSESAEKAIERTKDALSLGSPFDLCLMDVDFSQASADDAGAMNGFMAASEIHRLSPRTLIVMISAYSTEDNHRLAENSPWIEKFLRRGEFSRQELTEICQFALIRKLQASGKVLPEKDTLHTRSQVMLGYLKAADRISPTQPVVIFGETGTGKELTAKRLNANARILTGQENRPLVVINCGGVQGSLQHSEIFGHVRGAFTNAVSDRKGKLELADGGDVFLDELQNAPTELQDLLMRVFETQEITPLGTERSKRINVRFIAAMNKSPSEMRLNQTLKPDLLARLQKGYLIIPPMRERHGDIPALVEHFRKGHGSIDKTFSADAIAFLEAQPWPTNVRGLDTVVAQAIRDTKIPLIGVDALKRIPILDEMAKEAIQVAAATVASANGESHENGAAAMLASSSSSQLGTLIEHLARAWAASNECLSDTARAFEKRVLEELWKADPAVARVARRAKMPESTVKRKLREYEIIT